MDITKIIKGVVNATKKTVTAPIIKEDYGLYLKIEGLDLPPTYEVDFSNSETGGTSVTMIGNNDGVHIPNQFVKSGQDVFAFLYWVGEDYGRTVYTFRIPNKLRPDRTNAEPTPEEESLIDQAIAALNDAVEQTAADVVTTTAKAAEASDSASTASQKATQAANSAQAAGTYATRAENAQTAAEAARDVAKQKATAAANSADSAYGSAQDASGYAGDAESAKAAAAISATNAANSAQTASGHAGTASTKAGEAAASALAAAQSANNASGSATTASNKADAASQSANLADGAKVDAVAAKVAAEAAQTAAETAQGKAEDAQEAAETAQAAAEEAQSVTEGMLNTKAPVIVDTASGAVASFVDGADNMPMLSLVASIEPVQDLHGYDNPWPAGGGVNLLNRDTCKNGYISAVGVVKTDGSSIHSALIPVVEGATYVFSGIGNPDIGAGNKRIHGYSSNEAWVEQLTYQLVSTNVKYAISFTVPVGVAFVKTSFYGGDKDVQVESGSTATDYAPYSNICPIQGWTGCNVVRCGKNLINPSECVVPAYIDPDRNIIQSQTANGWLITGYISVKAGLTYTLTGSDVTVPNPAAQICFYDLGKNIVNQIPAGTTNLSFTVPTGCAFVRLSIKQTDPNLCQLELGSTATTYEPYQGNTYPISWQSEAGTVYGGTLDVVSGVLTVDRASVDLGTAYFAYNQGWNCWTTNSISDAKIVSDNNSLANAVCSIAKVVKASGYTSSHVVGSIAQNTSGTWFIDNGDSASLSGQLVYELATPITYQLTPTEVRTLLSQNNVWADTGDSSVEYPADTKLFITRKITEAIANALNA